MPILSSYPNRSITKFAGVDGGNLVGLTAGMSLTTARLFSVDTGATRQEHLFTDTDSGTIGPTLSFFKQSNTTANIKLGLLRFYGKDSGGNTTLFAELAGRQRIATDGAERGWITGQVMFNGGLSDANIGSETFILGYSTDTSGSFEYVFRGVTSVPCYMYLESRYTGAQGPSYNLWHDKTNVANDSSSINFDGRDSAGNYQNYCAIQSIVTDPTSTTEDSDLSFWNNKAGTFAERIRFKGDNINLNSGAALSWNNGALTFGHSVSAGAFNAALNNNTFFYISSNKAGAVGPSVQLFHDVNGAANNVLANITATGRDASAGFKDYAKIDFVITDATAATEDADIRTSTMIAGTMTENMRVSAGKFIYFSPNTTVPTLGTNGQFTMTPTSNTNFRVSFRGTDGTTRVANLTLA